MVNIPQSCKDELKNWLTDNAKDLDVTDADIVKRMSIIGNRAENRLRSNPNISTEDAVDRAIQEEIEFQKQEAEWDKLQSNLDILANRKNQRELEAAGFQARYLQKLLGGVVDKSKGARNGIDQQSAARFSIYTRDFLLQLKSKKSTQKDLSLYDRFYEKGAPLQIAKAIYGEPVNDKDFQEIANIWKNLQKSMREVYRSVGININELDGFITHRNYDPLKILQVDDEVRGYLKDIKNGTLTIKDSKFIRGIRGTIKGIVGKDLRTDDDLDILKAQYLRFRNWMLPRLDKNKTFEDLDNTSEDIERFMQGSFRNIIQRSTRSTFIKGENKLKSIGKFSNRIAGQKRKIFFNSAQGELEILDKFGDGNIQHSMIQEIASFAKNSKIAEVLGPDAITNYEKLEQQIIKEGAHGLKTNSLIRKNRLLFNNILNLDQIVNPKIAKISSNIRSAVSWLKLGGVTIKSIPDIAQHASGLRYIGQDFFSAWRNSFKSAVGRLKTPADEKAFSDLLLTHSHQIMGTMNRFNIDPNSAGTVSKINNLYYKVIGLQAWDHAHIQGFMATFSKELLQNKGNSFDDLNPGLRNVLNQYAIGTHEWNLIRKFSFKDPNFGSEFITPDSIRQASKDDVANYLGVDSNKVSLDDQNRITSRIEENMMTMFHDRANFIIQHPQAVDKVLLGWGLQRGTVMGELAHMVMLFRSFSIGFVRRSLGQWVNASPFTRVQTIAAGAELVAGTMIMGYLSQSASNFIRNRQPEDPTQLSTWYKAALPAMGIYSDILNSVSSEYGSSFTASLLGPVAKQVDTDVSAVSKLFSPPPANPREKRVFGDLTVRQLTHTLDSNFTGVATNIFYIKFLMNYLVGESMLNRIDPNAVQNIVKQSKQPGGTPFIISPT